MLENLELIPHESRPERIREVLEQVTENLLADLPVMFRPMVQGFLDSSTLFNDLQDEEKVDYFISEVKRILHYIENGND